jgi:uncharacterized protein (DUF1501 family)
MNISKRNFLKKLSASGAGCGALAMMDQLSVINAFAQTTGQYKALVCLYMYGGHDGNNTWVPTDNRRSVYNTSRGGIALNDSELISLGAPVAGSSDASTFALHGSLSPLAPLWEQGKLAGVFNVGPLVEPLTKAEYKAKTKRIPESLFSHSDQQAAWMTAVADDFSRTGWGGRLADRFASQGGQLPAIIAISDNSIFSVPPSGNVLVAGTDGATKLETHWAYTQAQRAGFLENMNLVGDNAIEAALARTSLAAITQSEIIDPVVRTLNPTVDASFTAQNATGRTAKQLRSIARIIAAKGTTGAQRQIFFVGMGGFDNHSNVKANLKTKFDELGPALRAFYDALSAINAQDAVTTFTMSDFGRTMKGNSTGGSDHAWGNHQIVMGGAVQGKKFYGTLPDLALGGASDTDTDGRWIPTTATEQYTGGLAQWFGATADDLNAVFPNRGAFGAALNMF